MKFLCLTLNFTVVPLILSDSERPGPPFFWVGKEKLLIEMCTLPRITVQKTKTKYKTTTTTKRNPPKNPKPKNKNQKLKTKQICL